MRKEGNTSERKDYVKGNLRTEEFFNLKMDLKKYSNTLS